MMGARLPAVATDISSKSRQPETLDISILPNLSYLMSPMHLVRDESAENGAQQQPLKVFIGKEMRHCSALSR